ncbi:MAG: DUF4864 domain-containing protein [Boseongicola sp.]|nr:DUF4864 domain-containing protein [Boseongicola sp.]MDD9976962.1 DUF4864 domain-containing protein [Boseongicola sp.]
MRLVWIAVLTWFAIAVPSIGQEALPRSSGIENTIQSQIDAFQVDDFEKAFTFASPNIRTLFGNSDRFGSMVRNGYPMVWRPSELRFLELREIAGNLWQKILVRDTNGNIHLLDYQMIQTDDGWRINGVQLLRAPDVGA